MRKGTLVSVGSLMSLVALVAVAAVISLVNGPPLPANDPSAARSLDNAIKATLSQSFSAQLFENGVGGPPVPRELDRSLLVFQPPNRSELISAQDAFITIGTAEIYTSYPDLSTSGQDGCSSGCSETWNRYVVDTDYPWTVGAAPATRYLTDLLEANSVQRIGHEYRAESLIEVPEVVNRPSPMRTEVLIMSAVLTGARVTSETVQESFRQIPGMVDTASITYGSFGTAPPVVAPKSQDGRSGFCIGSKAPSDARNFCVPVSEMKRLSG